MSGGDLLKKTRKDKTKQWKDVPFEFKNGMSVPNDIEQYINDDVVI